MTIRTIIGVHGAMPTLCKSGACPSVIVTDDALFVQGYTPAANESAALTAPTGESFVKMPRDVFEKIARHVLNK